MGGAKRTMSESGRPTNQETEKAIIEVIEHAREHPKPVHRGDVPPVTSSVPNDADAREEEVLRNERLVKEFTKRFPRKQAMHGPNTAPGTVNAVTGTQAQLASTVEAIRQERARGGSDKKTTS
jgi:hypothetical protein